MIFEQRLPAQWVYRPIKPDYGIDGLVEVFDERGQRTGRQFNVQLRATDERSLQRALAVQLKIDACKYYKSLDLPVLIARFHAPTNKLYVKWFHEFDSYYTKGGKKTTTFRLADSDEWSEITPAKLLGDLERIKCVRSGALPIPVPFRLQFHGGLIHGLSTTEISLNLRKALQSLPGALTLGVDPSEAYGTISISKDELAVNLAGLRSMVLHTKAPYGVDAARRLLHYDVLLASALTLDSAGYSDLAARLLHQFAALSSLIANIDIAGMVARCMVKAQRVNEAMSLAQTLMANPGNRPAASVLVVSMLGRSSAMSRSERALLTQFLESYAVLDEQTRDAVSAATANYNLANHLRSLSSYRGAFRRYRRAAKLDPKYCDRGYFCREMASVLFLSGRYKIAAKLYERALKLGENSLTRACLADALMFSGRYSEALEQLDIYLAAEKDPKSEFVLKAWALKGLQQTLKINQQKRSKLRALEIATPRTNMTETELAERLDEALRHDALCGLAWFNLGSLLSRQGKSDDACISHLWAALVQPKDAQAWANAFALSIASKRYKVLTLHIALAGRFASGEAMTEQLLQIAELQSDKFPKERFLALLDEILRTPDEKPSFEVRLLDEHGKAHSLPLKQR